MHARLEDGLGARARDRLGIGLVTAAARGLTRAGRCTAILSAPDMAVSERDMNEASIPAGLARRLAALVYDALLLAGVLLIFTVVIWVARGGREVPPGTLWFQAALVGVAGVFLAWFWTHGGQTVGMLAWKLRVVRRDGAPLGWPDAGLRFAAALISLAPFGLGYLWALVDRGGCTLHDRLSRTRVVRVSARAQAPSA